MSIWGANQAPALGAVYVAANDVTLTAGTEVDCIDTASALIGKPGANVYAIIWGVLTFLMGGTASAALVVAARYGTGADIVTQTVDTGLLVNSATITVPIMLVLTNQKLGANGQYGTGAIQITGKATTTACTLNHLSSQVFIGLFPAPDTQI
jgi:hypothetical protein